MDQYLSQYNLLLCSFYNSELLPASNRVLIFLLQYLLSYLNSLKPWVLPPQWEKANVSQMAWNLLQDSFHLPVKEASEILALGVLKLAIDASELEISNEGTSIVWWKVEVLNDLLCLLICLLLQLLVCHEHYHFLLIRPNRKKH